MEQCMKCASHWWLADSPGEMVQYASRAHEECDKFDVILTVHRR